MFDIGVAIKIQQSLKEKGWKKNMTDEVLYNLGCDMSSKCTFQDGDIQIASYEENIIQAIINRLNTNLNSLDLFYEDYGSVLTSFYGWKANNTTLKLIEVELDNALQSEQRLEDYNAELNYNRAGLVQIHLTLQITTDTTIELDLILNEDGLEQIENEEEDI